MNPSSTAAVEASASTMDGNNFMNAGRDMFSVTVNDHRTIRDGASEVREDGSSGSIATVFVTLTTLLGGIFGPKASEIDPISSGNIPQQSMSDCDARDHSEPRATVTEIQDTMASAPLSVLLDAFNSTVSPLTQSSSSERYIRSMLDCNEGFPLYEPEPESHEGARVGDVGLITEDGGFDFLFNVCPPPDISTNPDELPDDFEMLRAPEILVKTHFQPETRLFSNGVERTEEPAVKYTCSGPEGGVLELPSGATRFGAKNKLSFKELAIRHAENWYRYTISTRGRDAPNGSLYIVTSCIKCTDWGIAVFDRPSNPQDYLRLITNEENQPGPSKYRWKGSGAHKSKVAPNPGSADSNAAGSPNQCVLLRGYKIMLPDDIWNNITNSQSTGTSSVTVSPYQPRSGNKSESPRQGDSSNQDDASQSGTDNSPVSDCGTTRAAQNTCNRTNISARVILYEYSKTSPAHPSDLINAILLCQEPKAKVALTHDDDWCDLLRYHSQIHDSEALTKFGLPYTSNVDEYGCASLKRSDLNPSPNVAVVKSSSDTRVTPTSENRITIDNTTTIPTYEFMDGYFGPVPSQPWNSEPFDAIALFSNPHSPTSHDFRVMPSSHVVDAGVISIPTVGSFMCGAAEPPAASDLPAYIQIPGSSKRYRCMCGRKTKTIGQMQRHRESLIHSERKHECSCGKKFTRRDSLVRHMKRCKGLEMDGTQVSSRITTNPTHELPNKGDNFVLKQQDHRHTPNATMPFFIPFQTFMASSTSTSGSDVYRALAREDVRVDAGVTSPPPFGSFVRGGAESSETTTLPDLPTAYMETDEPPSKGDGFSVPMQEQYYWQPFDATTRSSSSHIIQNPRWDYLDRHSDFWKDCQHET